ncbi:MAG: UDP-N-acetylmuramoyl-L-alanyl-D-glutamate--2,6-diaminopimelate ligase [Treponema sp.]|jgi:UDP-N-acetylmuramoyl-L-alanyl-D-glutamate--2,6-diaminopimelate ligase|nr:UDP-N-acetylmuramoyl-L-alanyl-D-glutamate--2,6-diaminopimelate ligase [Treponema sp.]
MERLLSAFFSPDVAERAGCLEKSGPQDPLVTGLEYDSRRVKPGDLYFALRGLHTDGHRHIGQAIERGAVVIVHEDETIDETIDETVDEAIKGEAGALYLRVRNSRVAMSPIAAAFYGYPSQRMACIGVTGTEGKSTTVYLIWQLLILTGKKAGFFSTVLSSVGGDARPNPEHQTTPEATEVQRLLWEMAENGAEYAVVEASSHGLSPKTNRLGDVEFAAAVMTNVTHEHLEFHGTWEQYRDDKANLFRALRRQGVLSRFGVINADDPSGPSFAAAAANAKILKFSVRGLAADLSLGSITSDAEGNWYNVVVQRTGEIIDIRDRLPGAFNAANVLAALLVVSELLNVPVQELTPLAARLRPLKGRMTKIPNTMGIELLVDYAHTPSSFQTIFPPLRERLDRAAPAGKGRLICVFGSAGERDTKKRPLQGTIAASYADTIILCDEDPRGEDPMIILEEIAAGCLKGNPGLRRGRDLFLIPNRPTAIRQALFLAERGDLVLLLGKGHENSIIYADGPHPYDEIEEAEQAVAELWNTP